MVGRRGARVLVCNDDGIRAPGLRALARALAEAGADVFVVAPRQDMSAFGTSVGGSDAGALVPYEEVDLGLSPAVPAFAVDGTPAFATMAACRSGFGPPPRVVAVGINEGLNTGGRIVHSGTIGAALTAVNYGASALAISMDRSRSPHWGVAGAVAAAAVGWLLDAPPGSILNVNVPALPPSEVGGVRLARLARVSGGRATLVPAGPGLLRREIQPTGAAPPGDSDVAAVAAGWVAVTPLSTLTDADLGPPVEALNRALEAAAAGGLEVG